MKHLLRTSSVSRLAVALAAPLLGGLAANEAAAITVVNPSFEIDTVADDGNPATVSIGDGAEFITPTGWTIQADPGSLGLLTRKTGSYFNSTLATTPDPSDDEPAGKEQTAFANGGRFVQTFIEVVEANTTYTLTVDVGRRSDGGAPFAGAEIQLAYGTGVFDFLPPTSESEVEPTPGNWSLWTDVITTGSNPVGLGQPLRIDLISVGTQTQFDNVRLTAVAVPEPTALGLAVVGVAGLAARRRR